MKKTLKWATEGQKMFMWTVGYTVGDMMYIAQTTADQRRANWFSKVPLPVQPFSQPTPAPGGELNSFICVKLWSAGVVGVAATLLPGLYWLPGLPQLPVLHKSRLVRVPLCERVRV